jgi:hypothetical protein
MSVFAQSGHFDAITMMRVAMKTSGSYISQS